MFMGVCEVMTGSCASCVSRVSVCVIVVSGSVIAGGRSVVVCRCTEGDGDAEGSDVRSTASMLCVVVGRLGSINREVVVGANGAIRKQK